MAASDWVLALVPLHPGEGGYEAGLAIPQFLAAFKEVASRWQQIPETRGNMDSGRKSEASGLKESLTYQQFIQSHCLERECCLTSPTKIIPILAPLHNQIL